MACILLKEKKKKKKNKFKTKKSKIKIISCPDFVFIRRATYNYPARHIVTSGAPHANFRRSQKTGKIIKINKEKQKKATILHY